MMSRSTLSRRHRGLQGSIKGHAINLQLLGPQQEEELVKYTTGLKGRRLSPTKDMIQNFARAVVKNEVGGG
jgi:hypothetical protein